MSKLKIVVIGLLALLVVSVVIDVYQYNQVLSLRPQKDAALVRLEMVSVLSEVQMQVDLQLAQIDAGMVSACAALSTLDLRGDLARVVLSGLVASNSFIVNAATSDWNDTLLAVEPREYGGIEGVNICGQEQNIQMHATLRPALSNMILLVEGFYGVVLVAPIFDVEGGVVGSLSVVIRPGELINGVVLSALEGSSFSVWAMQPNGTLLYDPDPLQQGTNLFTDPLYVNNSGVQAFVAQVAEVPVGYGTYQYAQDTVVGELVDKEAYWVTCGVYGAEWRMVVVHVFDE